MQQSKEILSSSSLLLWRRGDDDNNNNNNNVDEIDNNNNDTTTTTLQQQRQGRHLVANNTINIGQIIFMERPLVSLQSLINTVQQKVQICYHCKSFIGTSQTSIEAFTSTDDNANNDNNNNKEEPIENENNNNDNENNNLPKDDEDDNNVETINDDNNKSTKTKVIPNIVNCRDNCGYVYCCYECEKDAWYNYHSYLCTGAIPDDANQYNHPLIKFKQYAIQTNEILLLIAEWWIAECQYYNTTTTNSSTNIMRYTGTQESPYHDFLMNPWWDAVSADMKSQHQQQKVTEDDLPNDEIEQQHQQQLNETERSLNEICDTASDLLSNVLRNHSSKNCINNNTDTDDNSNNSGNDDKVITTIIPPISSNDYSIRIGACEQNAMGIRQRHPLCRAIIENSDLRYQYHIPLVTRFYHLGLLPEQQQEDDENDENDDDDVDDEEEEEAKENDDDEEDNNNNNIEAKEEEDDDEAEQKTVDNIQNKSNVEDVAEAKDSSTKNTANIRVNPHNFFDAIMMKKEFDCCFECDDDDEADNNDDDKDRIILENYTHDDVAKILSNLEFKECSYIHDIAARGPRTDSEDMENNNSAMGNGDDYDIVFPPLDGTAMYSVACKMNHSCNPNIIILYNERVNYGCNYPLVAVAVALRPIQANEELTISYIETNQPYEQRQRALANYGFICTCTRCEIEKEELEESKQPLGATGNEDDADDDDDDDSPTRNGQNIIAEKTEINDDPNDDASSNEERTDDDDNNIIMSTDDDDEPESSQGENDLQQLIDRIDTRFNHSIYGTIPKTVMDPIYLYILETAEAIFLKDLDTYRKDDGDDNKQTIITDLLLKSCVNAIENRDYCMCKIVGCDLTDTVYALYQQHQEWSTKSYQNIFWCSSLTAAIGYAREWNFIQAIQYLDKAIIHGLPVGSECRIQPLTSYVEILANQMATGPYLPYFRCVVPDYDKERSELFTEKLDRIDRLSKPLEYSTPEIMVEPNNLELLISDYKINRTAVVIRSYATDWPALTKWRNLQWFAYHHGHRLIPVKTGSSAGHHDTKYDIQKFRSFIESYLLPSTSKHSWSLSDAINGSKQGTVACILNHPLTNQIRALQDDIDMTLSLTGNDDPTVVYVTVATGGTRIPLQHENIGDVILVQIVGVQYVRLYEYDDLFGSSPENYEIENATDVKYTDNILYPGDCIYIPSNTWYYTRSLTTCITIQYKSG